MQLRNCVSAAAPPRVSSVPVIKASRDGSAAKLVLPRHKGAAGTVRGTGVFSIISKNIPCLRKKH